MTWVVIFKAKAQALDQAYSDMAASLRDRALRDFGCLQFDAVTQGDQEIALSYWPDEASIAAWKRDMDHSMAQQMGRERWYASYSVEVAQIKRSYTSEPDEAIKAQTSV